MFRHPRASSEDTSDNEIAEVSARARVKISEYRLIISPYPLSLVVIISVLTDTVYF